MYTCSGRAQTLTLNDPWQGFRKYLTQAKDHEELLAFILGQIIKEKARVYQLQKYQSPEKITLKVSELDERVRHIITPTSFFFVAYAS